MSEALALRAAIDLVLLPSGVRMMRMRPLPAGVPFLLRIISGDSAALQEAIRLSERPEETIRAAAAFFVEQILLAPDSDSYRMLGVAENATYAELRRNMALLLRWLHPDQTENAERTIFAASITNAWNNLKTPERRAAYDIARAAAKQAKQDPAPPPAASAAKAKESALADAHASLGCLRAIFGSATVQEATMETCASALRFSLFTPEGASQ